MSTTSGSSKGGERGGASNSSKTETPRSGCKGEGEEVAAAGSSKPKTPRTSKGEKGERGDTSAAKKPKTKNPRNSNSGGDGGEGSSTGAVKNSKTRTPRSSKGKEREEGEGSTAGATSSPKTKAPHNRNRKETPDSPKSQREGLNGALAIVSPLEPSSALTIVSAALPNISNDAASMASSADSNWQPTGRIRKTRTRPVLHDLPPLQIGPAEVSNGHQALVIANENLTQEEFNTHIQERIQRVSRGAPAPTGMARGVPRNELVSKFENEQTNKFKAKWRKCPEVPTTEELLREVVHLPTNVIDGPFNSVDEYLEAHYELLREDAFSGLRDAVTHIRKYPESNDTDDIVIYEDVRVLGLTFSNMGVACKVSFSINRAGKKIRWEQSKRLIPGTLVCISSDKFQTVKVATVAARPKEGLEMNPPEIDLLFNEKEMELDTQKELLMVESKNGYFEAYKWTLRALQRMTIDNFPLHEHLCFLDSNISPPDYVKKKRVFNLSSIFPDNPDKEALEEVDIINDWPQTVQTSMDKSQMTGLHQILTKRLGILQGPPGTGKTFVSTNALQVLLMNMREGDPPIIVACQTNHALDQLLNHVLKFETEFIRLGGRTADKEKIKERTMYEMRQKANVNIQGSGLGVAGAAMKKIRDQMMKLLDPLKQELLTEEDFFRFGLITSAQARSFTSRAANWIVVEDDQRPGGYMGQWLGDYFVPIQSHEPVENEYEEGDIDYERIKEMEAEFHGVTDEIDGRLRGLFFAMGREYTVLEPDGVTIQEIHQGLQTSNVWELEEHTRAAMYLHLRSKVVGLIWAQVKDLNIKYQKRSQEHRIARLEKDAHVLSTTKLVGMTTTGLSKYRSIVAAVKPKIVLIEEAAEALEGPVTVACMPSVEHLILVGDHQQLRGHCAVGDLEGRPYYLDISMFERLVTNDLPFVTLRTQRRMRPEIRELLEPIYHDKLVDHASVLGRESIQGMGDINVFWYSHAYPESTDEVHSRVNNLEAQMVVHFADYLVLNGMDPKNITILTFYAGQRTQIRRTIMKNTNLGNTLMKVQTVDSYQGEENDVILLSLVRSNNYNSVGFLSIQNRVCVALSRAKRGFYIFGNATMTTTADKLWWEIGRILNEPPSRIGVRLPLTCQKHKSRTEIEDVLDWIDINGGCRKWCKEILPCRHACTLRCHTFEHKEIRCISPCTKFLACGHQCVNRLCWEECICPKCGRGQKALEAAPANASTQVVVRSAAGVGSGGRTMAIQEAPTPSQAGPVALIGQRRFENQLSTPDATSRQQGPPTPKLVEIDEWEAALPVNQQQQLVVMDREEFPEMAVAIRGPPGLPGPLGRQDGPLPPPRNASNYYYDDNYNPNAGPNMPTRGGGVYNVPRRQIKDRWPDEDENGQVIDNRIGGGYGQDSDRGGYGQGNRGDYDQYDDRGEYSQREGRGSYSQQGNRGDYGPSDDRAGYGQQGNRGDYSQRDDRGGYSQQGNRRDYDPVDSRGGYGSQGNRGDYSQRDDRGGYSQQANGGEYGQRGSQRGGQRGGQRDDRGGYSQESNGRGYSQQGEEEYNQRGDRGGYSQQGNMGEYSQQVNRNDYAQQVSRGDSGQQGSRGDYGQQVNRRGYGQQPGGGRNQAQDNEQWPALGAERGGPRNAGRGQDPRQTNAWNGNGIPSRGPPGGGPGGRGGGYDNSWGGRGRNGNRVANSYTQYR